MIFGPNKEMTDLKKSIHDLIIMFPPPINEWHQFRVNILLQEDGVMIMTFPMLVPQPQDE
jgi:hypothetical protein